MMFRWRLRVKLQAVTEFDYDHHLISKKIKHKVFAFPISHAVKGRLRLRVRGLYKSPQLENSLVAELPMLPNIMQVKPNTLTGSLLIIYDPALNPKTIIEAVNTIVGRALYEVLTGINDHDKQESFKPIFKYHKPWYAWSIKEVLDYCQSDEVNGLTQHRASERLQKYGPNRLFPEPKPSQISLFLNQFTNLPVALLIGSSVISLLTGGLADAILILSVVGINGYVGFRTERKADDLIKALHTAGKAPSVKVIREGKIHSISSEDLVIGDILIVESGAVAADARLIFVDHLLVDESVLTGESQPVRKTTNSLPFGKTGLNDRSNMLYKGSVVTSGQGKAVVVGIGSLTELGRIRSQTLSAKTPETVLQKNLHKLGNEMVFLSLTMCGGVFATGLLKGLGFWPMLESVVSLAVAAVPEGLPTVGTIALAIGVQKLREKNILARTLNGVEAIGSTQIFCFDKTGTLTMNIMQVDTIYLINRKIKITKNSALYADNLLLAQNDSDLLKIAELVSLCNDTKIIFENDAYRFKGSATESALVQLALTLGLHPEQIRAANSRVNQSYRTEDRQYMITTHMREGDRSVFEIIKGSPLQVLELCGYVLENSEILSLSPGARDQIIAQNDELAGQSLRILGVAYREQGLQDSFVWLGLVGLKDPLREGMEALIQDFHKAGIKTIMLTGDQALTAKAVAKDLGFNGASELLIAPDTWLDEIDRNPEKFDLENTQIFPRVSPSTKFKIVKTLQERSHKIVAMTGDGINDAPALRAANIGISLGQNGTSIAIESADIVVADDNLSIIYDAILQGRTIKRNLSKSIHFLLATNLSEMLLMFFGILLGRSMPLTPLQLLWINLLTDIFPSLALAMDAPDRDIMQLPPEDPADPLVDKAMKRELLGEGLLMSSVSFGVYVYFQKYGRSPSVASTAAFFALTGSQLLHAIQVHRKSTVSIMDDGSVNDYLNATVVLGFLLLVGGIYIPGLNRVLGHTPLKPNEALGAITAALLPFMGGELYKYFKKVEAHNPY